jgi:7-cyano-7-deazaguanine synthase
MDSTALLYQLRDEGHLVSAISIDYGQRHKKELGFAKATCDKLGVTHVVADLTALRDILGGSALTDDSVPVPHGHYAEESMKATVVPNRNMILLSVALGRCVALGYDAVAYAAHAGDHAVYPDCRPEFADAMNEAAKLCHFDPKQILRPFVNKSKADIARLGDKLGVDWASTWTCYEGGEKHCGKCGTCVERIEAFRIADVKDLAEYSLDPDSVVIPALG